MPKGKFTLSPQNQAAMILQKEVWRLQRAIRTIKGTKGTNPANKKAGKGTKG